MLRRFKTATDFEFLSKPFPAKSLYWSAAIYWQMRKKEFGSEFNSGVM
jgi:hypothetical protein